MSKEKNVNETNVMQLYTDCERVAAPCAIRALPNNRRGDVLMLSSTRTHSHFPKHSIEPYSSLAHPTAATSCIPTKLPIVITINHSINKFNNI